MKIKISITEVAVAVFILYILSLSTCGFIFLVNAVAVALASTPIVLVMLYMILFISIMVFIGCVLIKIFCDDYDHNELKKKAGKMMIISVVVLVLVGIPAFIISLYSQEWACTAIDVGRLEKPINVMGIQRFIPIKTAYAYAVDRLRYPMHTIHLDECYVYYANGSVIYNWLVEPEGFWNELTKKCKGVILVDAGAYPPRVKIIEKNIDWGLHTVRFNGLFFDNILVHALLTAGIDKKILLEDNVEVVYNGRVYILLPAVTWMRTFMYSLPVPAGYVVVDEDGNFEYIPIEKAKDDPRFKGVPLLPEVVAREWIGTYQFHTGVWNVILYHNTFTIRDVGSNPQPYLLTDSKGRLWWVFVAEPPGESYASKYIFYVPADTVKPAIYVYELSEPNIGISKLESYLKQLHPTFDWSQLSVEEPMPTILNGTLYWKVTVTTKDGRGLVSVDLVEGKSRKIISFMQKGKISYMDVLDKLVKGVTGETRTVEEQTPIWRIRELKEKITAMIEELQELLEQLEQLETQLHNNTRT